MSAEERPAEERPAEKKPNDKKPRRAITLGGGGPAAGLHIGVLEAFANADPLITFDVWSLSCIGAWVGIVYNQSASDKDSEKKSDRERETVQQREQPGAC